MATKARAPMCTRARAPMGAKRGFLPRLERHPDSSVIRRVECQSCRAHLGDTRALGPKFHGAKFAFTAFKSSSVKLFDRAPLSRKKKWPQVYKMDPYCVIETRGTDDFFVRTKARAPSGHLSYGSKSWHA